MTKKKDETTFSGSFNEFVEKIGEIIAEGNARRIVIEDKSGKVIFTIPVTLGVVGAVLVPWLAGVGAVAAVITECVIRVER